MFAKLTSRCLPMSLPMCSMYRRASCTGSTSIPYRIASDRRSPIALRWAPAPGVLPQKGGGGPTQGRARAGKAADGQQPCLAPPHVHHMTPRPL